MHVVELVRNNGISHRKTDGTIAFLMFDYFDTILYKELQGEDKNYLNYFSIGDTFEDDKNYKVSYKTLSLYTHFDNVVNPFRVKNDHQLTDTPFLGLIQISLCKENYVREEKEEVDVERFLQNCENEILKVADAQSLDPLTVRQLYRSSTTGDFCLVVRTDSVEKIYDIALALNDSQNSSEKKIKMLTYTNVGLECCVLEDGSYGTLKKEFVEKHKELTFSLRFSADGRLKALLEQYEKSDSQIKITTSKGLFGRYDYLLNIGIEAFAEIYPVLCEKKLGIEKQDGQEFISDTSDLKGILRYQYLRNINERILVNLDLINTHTYEDTKEKNEYLKYVIDKNQELYDQIEKIKEWKIYFSTEYRAFQDLYRGMKEIYKTFSAIGMEKEAYINWLMFCQDMELLCQSVNKCMEEYKARSNELDESEKRRSRLALLKGWRINIQAINQYTRLVQNVNYQTYQSPIYEIQTQIDTEKMMVAYREAMETYIESYVKSDIGSESAKNEVKPVIYPDLSKDRVEITAPFIEQRKRSIICTVPSFEYFGRLYDLLPWILHESSHHIRIYEREKRNCFVAKYVLDYVFRVVMEDILLKLSDNKLHGTVGRVERHLIDSMVEVAYDELCSQGNFKEYDFERMKYEIDSYLEKLFPFGSDFEGKQYQYGIREVKRNIYNYFFDKYQKEEMITDKSLELIMNIRDVFNYENCQLLANGLLIKYYNDLASEVNLTIDEVISLKEILYSKKYFEKRLVEVYRNLLEKLGDEDAVKEYCFAVVDLYRLMSSYKVIRGKSYDKEKYIQKYLVKVYDHYQERSKDWKRNKDIACLEDPSLMYTLRNLGLLNFEKETFCSKMLNAFLETDGKKVKEHREVKTRVYLESFADILMTTSLGINSFGYCRQMLQTYSDARIHVEEHLLDDINYERLQIVAAVLLENEIAKKDSKNSIIQELDDVKIRADSLVEKGKEYCEYTLKCIRQKMVKSEKIKKDRRLQKLLSHFLGDINSQIKELLDKMDNGDNYNATFLYIILHGEKKADKEIVDLWHKYKEFEEICIPIRYNFCRLECFCLGLGNILKDGYIIIPQQVFFRMKEIREKIEKEDGSGCIWENDWKCLSEPKMDVGKFYNIPELVLKKTPEQKLENTIDFVQNFYYFNRFKMIDQEKGDGNIG